MSGEYNGIVIEGSVITYLCPTPARKSGHISALSVISQAVAESRLAYTLSSLFVKLTFSMLSVILATRAQRFVLAISELIANGLHRRQGGSYRVGLIYKWVGQHKHLAGLARQLGFALC